MNDEDFKLKWKSRESGRQYELGRTEGKWWCTCPDFMYRKKKLNQHCKHIKSFIEFMKEQDLLQAEIAREFSRK